MTVEIKIKPGTKEVLLGISNLKNVNKRGLRIALNEIGSEVVNETVKFITTGAKTGRVYNYKGVRHQASAPGESPATRTGKLARSADYKVRNFQEMTVGESAEYAKYLEEGTRKMAPRPHLIRAVKANARDAVRIILESVRQEMR